MSKDIEQDKAFDDLKKYGKIVGADAPNFTLIDNTGNKVTLTESIQVVPVMLVFYGHDFADLCTQQLCEYKKFYTDFIKFGLQIFGISEDPIEKHAKFHEQYNLPFLLLTDPGQRVTKIYGSTSALKADSATRAIFFINTKGKILYKYIEPSYYTMRSGEFLLTVLNQLRTHKLI
jgi:thioredoxin-dependent peroxiredoxin